VRATDWYIRFVTDAIFLDGLARPDLQQVRSIIPPASFLVLVHPEHDRGQLVGHADQATGVVGQDRGDRLHRDVVDVDPDRLR
jgi:hypothetical protein